MAHHEIEPRFPGRAAAALAAALVSILFAATALAQPTITALNAGELPRSGRVVIHGSGFGAAGGQVVIAGLEAWTTTWTDTRIVAYVPEDAPPGSAWLYVVAGGGQSDDVALTVTLRQAAGRVRWRFEADADNLWYRPALAPDGTLTLHTSGGLVYSLTPDGGLRWVRRLSGSPFPYVPPTAGPDGAVYLGSISSVFALSPAGELRWEFDDPGAPAVQVAPAIGPDGRLYGAYEVTGAFALDPSNGERAWSNPGVPPMYDYGTAMTAEIAFSSSAAGGPNDQLYVHMDGPELLYAFGLDGEQRFATGVAGFISRQPVVGSDGTIYLPTFGAAAGWGVVAIDPYGGAELWIYDPANGNAISELAIGPDDTLYFSVPGRLEAVDPATVSRRWLVSHFQVMGRPALSPDGSVLVVGGVPNYGQPGLVKGFDAASGEELWTVDLPGEPYPGRRVLATDHARITPDGATAYVSTFTVADGSPSPDPHAYLYALDLTGESPPPSATIFEDDFELGGLSAWSGVVE
jgi:outer membrane protein assembly factor BamB